MVQSNRRRAIEDAALRLFAERSVAEVSVRDIAAAAGVGESALYRHMTSKEELAARVFHRAYLALAAELARALPEGAGLSAEVDALVRTALAAHDRDPVLFGFLLLRQHDSLPSLDLEQLNPVQVVRAVVRRALERGEMEPMDPDLGVAILMGIVLQPLTLSLYGVLAGEALPLAPTLSSAIKRALALRTPSPVHQQGLDR